jgi:hypothetical protein
MTTGVTPTSTPTAVYSGQNVTTTNRRSYDAIVTQRGALAHHDAAEVFGEVAGGRTTMPCSTASGSLAGKMGPMPPIYSILQRFI